MAVDVTFALRAIHSATAARSTSLTPCREPRSRAGSKKRDVVTNQAWSALCSVKQLPRKFGMYVEDSRLLGVPRALDDHDRIRRVALRRL